MREIDRRTIEESGVPGEVLMDRAGLGVASAAARLARLRGEDGGAVKLIAGKGNNGGDAFAAARHLQGWGFRVEVWFAGSSGDLQGDARIHFDRMTGAGIAPVEMPDENQWEHAKFIDEHPPAVLVDALLGTGSRGAPRGAVAAAVRYLGGMSARSLVLAVDVPSGFDADSGAVAGEAVVADMTATMAFPKIGFAAEGAGRFVGSVVVVDIGVPPELAGDVDSELAFISGAELRELLPKRPHASHKGTYGRVVLIGGAPGFAGAMSLAAGAACRSGVGLVSVMVPREVATTVEATVPEAMVHGIEGSDTGSLSAEGFSKQLDLLKRASAILVGPGMTTHPDSRGIVETLLRESRAPVVLDADALNVCEGDLDVVRSAGCPVVLTPHPGEMGRLLQQTAAVIQADRQGAVRSCVEATGAVVVLKGAGTLIGAPGNRTAITMTGNPGMATGGMGDVLSGLVAGLAARGIEPCGAARLAVHLHGVAGDVVSWRTSQDGMTAGDVVRELPRAFRHVAAR